jgi:hypothetical protein
VDKAIRRLHAIALVACLDMRSGHMASVQRRGAAFPQGACAGGKSPGLAAVLFPESDCVLKIRFEKSMDGVPDDVLGRLQLALTAVAQKFATTARAGALARAASVRGLMLDVPPWRFQYRIDMRTHEIVVEDAQPA